MMKRSAPLFSVAILFIIFGLLNCCSVNKRNNEFALVKDLEIGE